MRNTYKLIWSDEALINLRDLIDYLENRWTEREIKKFAKLLDRNLQLIQENPLLFSESEKSNRLRKAVISKQTTLYYEIVDFEIQIVTLFDNRQNPKKLRFK